MQGTSTFCTVRSTTGCSKWCSMGFKGTDCSTMGFSVGFKGISAPASATSLLSSSLTLVSARLFLSHFLTPCSRAVLWCFFNPFLNIASSGSFLEPSEIRFYLTIGSYLSLLTEDKYATLKNLSNATSKNGWFYQLHCISVLQDNFWDASKRIKVDIFFIKVW